MAETENIELVQGKTWEINGTVYAVDGALLPWTDYNVRGKARKKYTDVTSTWDWVITLGTAGKYTAKLGAVASALIPKGVYVSDFEVFHRTDLDIVNEIKRLAITVLPEATK